MGFESHASPRELWFSCLVHITLLLLIPTTSSTDNTTDYLALLSFKSLVSDPVGALASWNSSNPHLCQWRGVTCGNPNHPERVTALELSSLNLTGPISPYVSNLTFLTKLDLSTNHFLDLIPEKLSRLLRLRHLNLSYNSLIGEIPGNLSNCSHLQKLVLRNNMLVGMIPVKLGSLSNLSTINLGENSLSGSIPASFGNLSSLTGLFLDEAGLEGRIPESLGKLSNLKTLQVSINKLSGEIPPSLYNLSSIQYFVVGDNHLAGALPPTMFDTLPSLQMVLLYGNSFSGSIPFSLPNASKLVELDLRDNKFSGMVPSNLGNLKDLYWINLNNNSLEADQAHGWDFLTSLTNCTHLGTLGLSKNRLGGILPSSIANLSSHLDLLAIGENQIAGTIPDGIGNLVNLSVLILNGNQLSGIISPAIGSLIKLYALALSDNNFTGQIPSSIGNLTQLNQLDLRASGVERSIPVSFGNCSNLNALDLSHNKLSGVIPKELVSLRFLSIFLDISHNFLTGDLPAEISEMSHLSVFDASNNRLSGVIPSSLGDCESLEFLYLQGNFLNGTIPQSLSKLRGLQKLDLSNNNLSGFIPESLGKLSSLLYLNFSFNNLQGEVPKEGIFLNASGIAVTGNNKLCGGMPQLHLLACSPLASRKKKLSTTLTVIISVISLILCIIVLLILFAILRWKKSSRVKYLSTSSIDVQFRKISYLEIARATNGFSPSNLIGIGSFGSVYKGILDSDENIVAVKVLNLEERGASKSFIAECEALRNIRHRNLVRVLNTCSSVDSQGNDFKALILEFMPNGSLDKWLHPEEHEVSEQWNLSLIQRFNIAIDVASALDYLHEDTHIPIVHRDLKPSNVLLDDDICARVSDFGLARFLSNKFSEPDEYQTSSIGIKGSIGYIAPEYGTGSRISTRGDVFSYGILLLEMFTRKRPTDEIFEDGTGLHKLVEMAFPDRVMDVVDPCILSQAGDTKSTGTSLDKKQERNVQVEYCLASALRIGLSCSNEDPRERMEMRSVTKELLAIRDLLLDSRISE